MTSVLDTSERFGFEWNRYREFFPGYEEQFLGWIEPLGPDAFAGRDVLDAGCGMGRNNEHWVRLMRWVHPALRKLSPAAFHALTYLCSIPIFLGLKLPLRKSIYLRRVSRYPFSHLHKIVFDQLLPDVARYYTRAEVEELFSGLELSKVEIHHSRGYSWTVLCER